MLFNEKSENNKVKHLQELFTFYQKEYNRIIIKLRKDNVRIIDTQTLTIVIDETNSIEADSQQEIDGNFNDVIEIIIRLCNVLRSNHIQWI